MENPVSFDKGGRIVKSDARFPFHQPVTAFRVPTTLDSWLEINERSHEPTNEELGIKPCTGWRLVTFWLCAGVFSCAVFWGIGEALLAVLP